MAWRRWRNFVESSTSTSLERSIRLRLAAEAIARSEPQEDGLRGVVVMTSSVSAFDGQIGQAAYSASKGGVASLTLPMAREFGQHGIRVVSIAPGVFDTPMMQAAPEKVRQSLIDQTHSHIGWATRRVRGVGVSHLREQHAQRLRAASGRSDANGAEVARISPAEIRTDRIA